MPAPAHNRCPLTPDKSDVAFLPPVAAIATFGQLPAERDNSRAAAPAVPYSAGGAWAQHARSLARLRPSFRAHARCKAPRLAAASPARVPRAFDPEPRNDA